MFETAELGLKLSKREYAERAPLLRSHLLRAQHELKDKDFPVIVVIGGTAGSGKGNAVNLLGKWLDARFLTTPALEPLNKKQHREHPYKRFWMELPPKGRISIFSESWYSQSLRSRAYRKISPETFDRALQRINAFELALVNDGALILKFWLHIREDEQRSRFKELRAKPETEWRVTDQDLKDAKKYKKFKKAAEHLLAQTSSDEAPWTLVESEDPRFRNLAIAQLMLERLRDRFKFKTKTGGRPEAPIPDPTTVFDTLDLSQKLAKKDYDEELEQTQSDLNRLSRKLKKQGIASIIVFEGWDAAGKGGAIRRLIGAIDARQYRVIPVSAPNDEEKSQHYLWRFWRHLPEDGAITVYDRSWYGRVLVERVEGFASDAEWNRAYREINEFEAQLKDHGIVVIKFWLHISRDEQLRRFKEREATPWKQHKITDEDYRNRKKFNQYEAAAKEMVERTSTPSAPWTLVEAEDKYFARIKVLHTVRAEWNKALRQAKKSR